MSQVKVNQVKKHFYLVSLIQFLIFIPFLLQRFVGADWDSYALVGTVINLYNDSIYLPSRPPGFPVYEYFLTILYSISDIFNINFEFLFLVNQFLFVLANNYLILLFFYRLTSKNFLLYYVALLSPIYLISGFSVIDYHAGLFFGLLGIYLVLYSPNLKYSIPLTFAISAGLRLSNVIFILAALLIVQRNSSDFKIVLRFLLTTGIFTIFIYLPGYISLWDTTLSSKLANPSDMFCVLNLTNTDHTFYGRIGRFILKQLDFFGILGTLLVFGLFSKFRFENINKNYYFFIIFILFEISFLRLPTERGHLLPAFISLVIILNSLDFKKITLLVIFISTFIGNFVYLSIYDVDQPDSATEIYFNLQIKPGLLIQDYEKREEKGKDKDFYYDNSYYAIQNVWIDGCPNK